MHPKFARLLSGLLLVALLISGAALACTAPPWDATTTYTRGDVVSYQYHEWRAKRTTTNVVPGTHRPSWTDLGACDTGEPPPPPVTTPIQILDKALAGMDVLIGNARLFSDDPPDPQRHTPLGPGRASTQKLRIIDGRPADTKGVVPVPCALNILAGQRDDSSHDQEKQD